jgi:HAD superfamily hydrolase (TIGR01509 family)
VRNVQAVIWDFDGTMVDTEPVWASTEQQMMAEHGVIWSDEMMRAKVGQPATLSAKQMAQAAGLPDEVDRFYRDLHDRVATRIRTEELPFLPGVKSLIHELERNGTKAAVVTASNGQIIEAARERLPEVFEFIITADDVPRSKPHPDPYLQAFERLGVDPLDAIILEDSVPGSRSALDAGGLVFAVPQFVRLPPDPRMHISPDALETTTFIDLNHVWRTLKEKHCNTRA